MAKGDEDGFSGPNRRHDDSSYSGRELLARLDERTERLDRDIRQMMSGQRAHAEALEASLNALSKKFDDEVGNINAVLTMASNERQQNRDKLEFAAQMIEKHDQWLTWAQRTILGALFTGAMALLFVTV